MGKRASGWGTMWQGVVDEISAIREPDEIDQWGCEQWTCDECGELQGPGNLNPAREGRILCDACASADPNETEW